MERKFCIPHPVTVTAYILNELVKDSGCYYPLPLFDTARSLTYSHSCCTPRDNLQFTRSLYGVCSLHLTCGVYLYGSEVIMYTFIHKCIQRAPV